MPAICELMSKEGCVVSEEDAAMVVSDAIMTLSQRGQSLAELPAMIEAEAASINSTGQLIGGSSSNFMNAMYELLATNQVSVQFFMDNADFFTTLFSWLGADLEPFPDIANSSMPDDYSRFETALGFDLPPIALAESYDWNKIHLDSSRSSWGWCVYGEDDQGRLLLNGNISASNGGVDFALKPYGDGYIALPLSVNSNSSNYALPGSSLEYSSGMTLESFLPYCQDGIVMSAHTNIVLSDLGHVLSDESRILLYDASIGEWNSNVVTVVAPGESQMFDGQVIGQDAKYDEAGNITDYGNVTVPDVFAPNYTAPGSYAEALNQMNATATTESPAHADSPSFGQSDTTVKDWVDGNQTPKPDPSDETAQDGFKVEDLEKVFPFCIPWDLYYLLSMFAAEPVAPHIAWPFDFGDLGKFDLDIDLSEFESVAAVVRTCETVLFCVGLAFATRELVRG